MTVTRRIGFACKYMHEDQTLSNKKLEDIQRQYNEKSTTATWLRKQSHSDAVERLISIVQHNAAALTNLITYVSTLPKHHHMLRIGSNQVPMYTHPEWRDFWNLAEQQLFLERLYAPIGKLARDLDVRLSFHPGQFVVLASDRPDVVENSIEEFEYHADLIRFMGYGQKFQDFKCNVHISGKLGPDGIIKILPRLSTEARNTITIENEEMRWGLDDVLLLKKHVPIVFDIHHNWVNTGQYLSPNDSKWQEVLESWRGVRPTMHYSLSRDSFQSLMSDTNDYPDMDEFLQKGAKKSKLRAHSDRMWSSTVNQHVAQFWPDADIMIEAKHKNLAALDFGKEIS